jgi:hypothetical protein
MMRAALFGAVLASRVGAAAAQPLPPDEPQPLLCVGPGKARRLVLDQNLVPPIRAMRQAAAASGAEPIDIQLCWFHGALVYDVTLLDRNGPMTHRLMSGMTGAPLGEPGKP